MISLRSTSFYQIGWRFIIGGNNFLTHLQIKLPTHTAIFKRKKVHNYCGQKRDHLIELQISLQNFRSLHLGNEGMECVMYIKEKCNLEVLLPSLPYSLPHLPYINLKRWESTPHKVLFSFFSWMCSFCCLFLFFPSGAWLTQEYCLFWEIFLW